MEIEKTKAGLAFGTKIDGWIALLGSAFCAKIGKVKVSVRQAGLESATFSLVGRVLRYQKGKPLIFERLFSDEKKYRPKYGID